MIFIVFDNSNTDEIIKIVLSFKFSISLNRFKNIENIIIVVSIIYKLFIDFKIDFFNVVIKLSFFV